MRADKWIILDQVVSAVRDGGYRCTSFDARASEIYCETPGGQIQFRLDVFPASRYACEEAEINLNSAGGFLVEVMVSFHSRLEGVPELLSLLVDKFGGVVMTGTQHPVLYESVAQLGYLGSDPDHGGS